MGKTLVNVADSQENTSKTTEICMFIYESLYRKVLTNDTKLSYIHAEIYDHFDIHVLNTFLEI